MYNITYNLKVRTKNFKNNNEARKINYIQLIYSNQH